MSIFSAFCYPLFEHLSLTNLSLRNFSFEIGERDHSPRFAERASISLQKKLNISNINKICTKSSREQYRNAKNQAPILLSYNDFFFIAQYDDE